MKTFDSNVSFYSRKTRRKEIETSQQSNFSQHLPSFEKAKRWAEERNSQRDNDPSWDYDK